eukprot:comp17775_c0_seq1/m.17812 comp17775_c0_seq1/g.17812  ORF comp17775_c0_seq1/g.17812 comp17775_c0_seq1/m.17812 type:complete len:389 (-) comp17775_c0_seq1:37-1203(-)
MANDDGSLPKLPNLELAQLRFELLHADELGKDKAELKSKLLAAIEEDNMAPFYAELCAEAGWAVDSALKAKMEAWCEAKNEVLTAAIEDAEKNLGETETRDCMVARAEHYCRIGDKEKAVSAFRQAYDKTVSLGHRLDIVFTLIRMGLFYMDYGLVTRNIEKAKTLIEEGGDWDRRNRLKVYEGTYLMAVRSFRPAATLFLDAISTFTASELMHYHTFGTYTALVSLLTLDRVQLGKKVVNSPEILEAAHERPILGAYIRSLYDCNYAEFFRSLAAIEGLMKADRYLYAHYRYYVREMRIVAYSQLLESYRSVTLQSMAASFGVSPDFIDMELSRFIGAGRLSCKVDKVGGTVETARNDRRTGQYTSVIKSGDLLLGRVQKLSRVINI